MGTYSSILDWRIPWAEELGELQSVQPQRVGYYWATHRIILYHLDLRSEIYISLISGTKKLVAVVRPSVLIDSRKKEWDGKGGFRYMQRKMRERQRRTSMSPDGLATLCQGWCPTPRGNEAKSVIVLNICHGQNWGSSKTSYSNLFLMVSCLMLTVTHGFRMGWEFRSRFLQISYSRLSTLEVFQFLLKLVGGLSP